jgi:hypothetical protein
MNETKPDTPFPRHRYYYIALKLVVLGAAIALAVYVFGEFWSAR